MGQRQAIATQKIFKMTVSGNGHMRTNSHHTEGNKFGEGDGRRKTLKLPWARVILTGTNASSSLAPWQWQSGLSLDTQTTQESTVL